jgi:hypothetical protein
VALLVAIPATRLEGFYLALATLAFAQLFIVLLNEGGQVTGGTGGLANYRLPDIAGWRITGPSYTVVIVLLMLGTLAVLWRLDQSHFGRACRAARDNPEAAAAMGVDVRRTRIIAYTLTSALAGLAGVVYAFVDNTVNPNNFWFGKCVFAVVHDHHRRHWARRRGGVGCGAVVFAAICALAFDWAPPCAGVWFCDGFGGAVPTQGLDGPVGCDPPQPCDAESFDPWLKHRHCCKCAA